MNLLRRLSIRGKLVAFSMTGTGVALLVACAIFLAYDYHQIQNSLVDDWTANADIVGGNSTAAISFNDSDAAANTLRVLAAEPELEVSALYTPSGDVLAKYSRPNYDGAVPPRPEFTGARFGTGYVEVCQPVLLNGKEIGRVYVRADLQALYAHMRTYGLVMTLVFAGVMTLAYLMVNRLQRIISGPILNLTHVARTVSATKDYGIRVGNEHKSEDELGELVDRFDDMLAEIQTRDKELTAHRENLEAEVSERTAELRATNEQLTTAKLRAEEASAAKSAFLANMSHEIRTPMTAIVGYADNMLDPDQTLSDRQDALQTIRRNAQHLLELINDILDISKIEADKMTVERVACDLPALLSDLLSLMRPRAIAKGVDFHLQVEGAVPKTVSTDPLRLRQVLMNILANAVKFTNHGEIRLRVRLEKQGEQNLMRFDVCDTGIGISREQLDRLFRPFTQADESMTRRFGGTGLGLTISQRLAVLLGGGVTVESRLGQGSIFTVRIDVGSLEGAEMIRELTEAILPKPTITPVKSWSIKARILLVEDGADNQRLISMHLRKAGADVTIADNGRKGVDAAMLAQATLPFDLILMDMQMPELDGYGAATELRKRNFKQPIIALTAHAMSEDREKCLKAGCTDYLTKPIEKNLLLGTVAGHLRQIAAATLEANTASSSGAKPNPASSVVRSEFADDTEMKEVLGEFVAQLPDQVKRLATLMEQNNLDDLRRAVHQLKGAGGGYGFPMITQIAAAAEERIKESDTPESIQTQVHYLIDLIRRVEGYNRTREEGANATANPGH
jgi:two-component system, sensor histidine kinase